VALDWPFLGSEALALGLVNRYQLRTCYDAVFRNVYVPKGQALTAADKAIAAWLWSGRRATVAGLSAAALLGTRWIDANRPAELNQASQHKTKGIILHSDRLWDDEVCSTRGITVTSPVRTAYDLGRRPGLTAAVIRLDALMQSTKVKPAEIELIAERHRGTRGTKQLREALALSDSGAESPQETRTRPVLTSAGLRPQRTQIEILNSWGEFVHRVDMGWDEWRVGVEYDGIQHWADPDVRTNDIDWQAEAEGLGWRFVRVGADMLRYRQATIVSRTRMALRAAGAPF
jgi:hypothetical protein